MNDPVREPPVAGAIFFLLAGPILWGGHLLAVYTFHAVACAAGGPWTTTIIPGSIVVATLAAAGALLLAYAFPGKLAQVLRCADRGNDQPFLIRAGRLLTVLSLAGVLWTGSAALALAPCAQFR
ncbi:hypothetical protein [Sinorhizobium arboris]|uniref:hypothetical protein n=1 Tax=Sinorhizobium arboris TaxID=76745 RepID=UPI0003FD41AB|nr:hypothetical protein [Sinorhizobium arboris]